MPKRKRKNDEDNDSKVDVKYKGVMKKNKRYQARVRIEHVTEYVGMFDTAKEAAQAYDSAAIQAGHLLKKLNFPKQAPKDYQPKKKKNFQPKNIKVCRSKQRNTEHGLILMAKLKDLVRLTQLRKLPERMIVLPSKQDIQQ